MRTVVWWAPPSNIFNRTFKMTMTFCIDFKVFELGDFFITMTCNIFHQVSVNQNRPVLGPIGQADPFLPCYLYICFHMVLQAILPFMGINGLISDYRGFWIRTPDSGRSAGLSFVLEALPSSVSPKQSERSHYSKLLNKLDQESFLPAH